MSDRFHLAWLGTISGQDTGSRQHISNHFNVDQHIAARTLCSGNTSSHAEWFSRPLWWHQTEEAFCWRFRPPQNSQTHPSQSGGQAGTATSNRFSTLQTTDMEGVEATDPAITWWLSFCNGTCVSCRLTGKTWVYFFPLYNQPSLLSRKQILEKTTISTYSFYNTPGIETNSIYHGGSALLVNKTTPHSLVSLRTNLQATAVRIITYNI